MTGNVTGDPGPQEESVLRRGMSEFAQAQAGPGPALSGLLDRAHRARRRQRAVRAAAAGVCVIAVATVGVAFAQRSTTQTAAPPAASRNTMTPSNGGLPPLPLPARTEDARSRAGLPMPQPSHPVIGTSYPYNWYAHCGMVYVTFGGKAWKVDQPVTVPPMHPDSRVTSVGPPDVPGYVTLTSPTSLRFDAPTYIIGVPLHRTTETPPICA